MRDAIASHRTSEGGDGIVTLILERPVNSSAPLAPRESITPKLAPLQDIVLDDLRQGPAKDPDEQAARQGVGQRLAGLLDPDGAQTNRNR